MKWSSFVKIAFRNIILHRGFSLVSLLGLSAGIAMALLVLAYVDYETSYDKHFQDSDKIYRLVSHGKIGSDVIESALTPLPLVKVASNISGIVSCSRLIPASKKLVKSQYAKFNEQHFFYADKGFFDIFNLSFLLGNSTEIFSDSNAVVISKNASHRFFGTRNPMGEELILDNGIALKVTGVFNDLPENTHLKADFIANWHVVLKKMRETYKNDFNSWDNNWFALNTYSYIKITTEADIDSVELMLNNLSAGLMVKQLNSHSGILGSDIDKMEIKSVLQPISEIHLSGNLDHELSKGSSGKYVSVFTGIAVFILVITAINFMNITTARASRRFKEIAVRKTFGAGRRHIVTQFFIESILFSSLALGIALVFMELFFQKFSILFDIPMGKGSFINHINFGWVFLISLFVGIVGGSYPSFFFSGLEASKIYKGQSRTGRWGIIVRGVLTAFQICIAVALMSISLSMHNQLNFLENTSMGYDPQGLVAVEREYALGHKADSVKNLLKILPEVEGVSSTRFLPGEETSILSYKNVSDTSQVVLLATNLVDSTFFETLGAVLLKGRLFNNYGYKDSSHVIINESAAKLLGFTNLENSNLEVIGSGLKSKPLRLQVIGVVGDIHYESFKIQVRPMIFMQFDKESRREYVLIKFKEGNMPTGIKKVEGIWNSVLPDEPFDYFNISERVDGFYREEQRFARIGLVLAVIAMVFAILGLIGLVSFVVLGKLKNMEISRMLSAAPPMILLGTFRGVSWYIFAGIFASLLISPLVIDYWLKGFYSSFSPSGYCLVIPMVLMIILAFFTVYIVGIREFNSSCKRAGF